MCLASKRRLTKKRCSGLSSSREFYQIKRSVNIPAGGWTNRTFKSQAGVRLIAAIMRVRRSAQARSVRESANLLYDFLTKQVDDVIAVAEELGRGLPKYPKREDHAALWKRVVFNVFSDAEPYLKAKYKPVFTSMMMEVYRKTCVLLSVDWRRGDTGAFEKRIERVMRVVPLIVKSNRKRIERSIARSLASGDVTVADVSDDLKKSLKKQITGKGVGLGGNAAVGSSNRAADEAVKAAIRTTRVGTGKGSIKESNVVTHVSVFGCETIEDEGPMFYAGIPTCNIQDVPVEDMDELEFHINHTGAIIPSQFINDDGSVPDVQPSRGDD